MTKRILIIDNEKTICDLIDGILSGYGYEALRAYDSESGFKLIPIEKPDLLLIDATSDDLKGIELCKKIKKRSSMRHLPIILMIKKRSALNISKRVRELISALVEKPIQDKQLLRKVGQFIIKADEKTMPEYFD